MKKTAVVLAVILQTAALGAQSLDPTVEVSRVYEGKLIEVHKPAIDMDVPDTLYRFDHSFDYSVFRNPYRGAYEFNPYMMDMKPVNNTAGPLRFFMRAGAGYTLHPTFDLLWSPDIKGAFKADIYASHKSYVGAYRSVAGNPAFKGYDLLSEAGADFGYDWKKAALEFGASYYGVAVKDFMEERSYNALDAYVSLNSKSLWPEHFMYDVGLRYRYAGDNSAFDLETHDLAFDMILGPRLNRNHKMFFDVEVDLGACSGSVNTTVAGFGFTPHYLYEKGRFRADLGVRIDAVLIEEVDVKNQVVYPDVHIHLDVIPNAMRLYADIGGGSRLNTYAGLLKENHHFNVGYASDGPACLFRPTVERVSAEAGLEGRISRFFSYNLRGGYVNCMGAPFEAALEVPGGGSMPFLGYSGYQKGYASIDWELDVRTVKFDGNFTYSDVWDVAPGLFAPAAFTADAELQYNWRKRIYAGVDGLYSSARSNGLGGKLPWYVDLGVYAEYALNRRLSFWLRGGNLLNMEIQRNLFVAEKGVSVTAGISLNL